MLRFLTAGESHGQALVAILEGMPAGLAIDVDQVAVQPRRRQGGYGRGRRMAIDRDRDTWPDRTETVLGFDPANPNSNPWEFK